MWQVDSQEETMYHSHNPLGSPAGSFAMPDEEAVRKALATLKEIIEHCYLKQTVSGSDALAMQRLSFEILTRLKEIHRTTM